MKLFAGTARFADNPRFFRPGTWLETGVGGCEQAARIARSMPIRLATQQQDRGK
jgi:hypothetical protein